MIISNHKKRGCLLSLILILIVAIGFICFQVLMNTMMYFLLTWPIWLGKAFDFCLEFAQKSTLNKVIITFSFVLIGILLYKIKKGALIIFGAIEFIGGVFVIWGSFISPSSDNLVNAIALSAGLFLIVQGAENYLMGHVIEEERKKSKSHKAQAHQNENR